MQRRRQRGDSTGGAGGEQEGGVLGRSSLQGKVREDSGKEQCGGARRGLQGPELPGGSEGESHPHDPGLEATTPHITSGKGPRRSLEGSIFRTPGAAVSPRITHHLYDAYTYTTRSYCDRETLTFFYS